MSRPGTSPLLRTYLQGWINYFGIGMKYNDAVGMDQWIRRRIRMCYWKQWRWPRKRIGELIKLGAPRYHAILTGLSRKATGILRKRCQAIASCRTSIFKGRGFCHYEHCGFGFTIRLRPDNFHEPPGADPHAGVWGGTV